MCGNITCKTCNPVEWRCFHCDECFYTVEAAKEHFGSTERQQPACTIDIAEYRRMEQRMLAYNEEDADIHREMHARLSDHQLALKREEERGYAKGIADTVGAVRAAGEAYRVRAKWLAQNSSGINKMMLEHKALHEFKDYVEKQCGVT